jgi:hypothetical protein
VSDTDAVRESPGRGRRCVLVDEDGVAGRAVGPAEVNQEVRHGGGRDKKRSDERRVAPSSPTTGVPERTLAAAPQTGSVAKEPLLV